MRSRGGLIRLAVAGGPLTVLDVGAETEQERGKRRYQRALFDGVAGLYQASRPGYPGQLVEFVVATAGLDAGSTVLEVGCGTGQLTERLAGFGFGLTAIDIGPSMIAAARHRLDGSAVSFQVSSFEDLAAADASFDLVICGASFHWVDPEVRFAKSLLENLPTVGGTDLDLPGQDAACRRCEARGPW